MVSIAMAGPIDITFDVLSLTSNIHAVEVLIDALDLSDEAIQKSAVVSLIKRHSTRGLVEVIRRLETLSDDSRAEIENQSTRIATALKQSLLHGDDELRLSALRLVQETENYDQIPTLLQILQGDHNDLNERAMQIVVELVNRLYEHCRVGNSSKAGGQTLRNSRQIRQSVLTALDQACSNSSHLSHPEELVECILILGDPENYAVKKVLSQSSPGCRELAIKTMFESAHPGIMQLVLDFMSKNYPHAKSFEAISQRGDPEFVCFLLRWVPNRFSELQQKNLQQIRSVVWLNPYGPTLEMVPEGLQKSLVALVSALGLPADQKTTIQEWIVRYGSLEGRLAATNVLSYLDNSSVENILYDSLDAEDEEVQAWATGQLRSQGIPEAVTLLLGRLDSPKELVREMAREELGSFNLEFVLELFEELRPDVCLRAGEIIQKIDPECLSKLSTELGNPIRRKRIRAARAALAMGLHAKVVPALIAMLDDEDQLVRRTGIEVLGHVRTPEVIARLTPMRNDPSPRVRETAIKALETAARIDEEGAVGLPK